MSRKSVAYTWKFKEVLDYPDPTKRPRQEYEDLRLRCVGVRDDGQVFQAVGFVSGLEMIRCKEARDLVAAELSAYLDRIYLNHPGYVEGYNK